MVEESQEESLISCHSIMAAGGSFNSARSTPASLHRFDVPGQRRAVNAGMADAREPWRPFVGEMINAVCA